MLSENQISRLENVARRPSSNISWRFFVLDEMFCGFPLFVQEHNASPNTQAAHNVKLSHPFVRRWTSLKLSVLTNILAALNFEHTIATLDRKTRLLSFDRTQSRVVIGLLIGHNTLRRHHHLNGLINNISCRRFVNEEETSLHIMCECEALASHSQMHIWVPSSWTQRILRVKFRGPSGTLVKVYNHTPSSSVGSHVLIPRNRSVLSSTKII
jgi:hypothetical protein